MANNFPKVDRSNFKPHALKGDDGILDIASDEGVLSDGRPYRVEFWCQDQVSCLTFFMSTRGIENADRAYFLRLLKAHNLLEFTNSSQTYLTPAKWVDAAGNEMWSVNAVIGDEAHTYVRMTPLVYG